MNPHVLQASARAMGFDSWDRHDDLDGGRGEIAVAWRQHDSYVVKAYDPDKPSPGAREKSALAALAGASGTPELLAEGADPAWVVMSRLEGSHSLADSLLGPAPERAHAGLMSWAEALARLHDASTPAVADAFERELGRRAPRLAARSIPLDFAEAAASYPALLRDLGLARHDAALEELEHLPARLADGACEVLTPADTCPDNNLLAPGRMHLLDFEFAELRHAAWDVAYLRVPWPSCWCAWRLPERAAEEAVAHYRAVRGEAALGTAFGSALDVATLGWALMTPAFFIRGALTSDDGDRLGRPSRRSFVLHRLEHAARTTVSGPLAELARDLHDALHARWGDTPLDLAPAFRS